MNISFNGLDLAPMRIKLNGYMDSQEKTKRKVSLSFVMDKGTPSLVAMTSNNVVAIIAYINSEGKFYAVKYAKNALDAVDCDTSWASWDDYGAIQFES